MAQQFVASMSDQNNFPFQNLSSDEFEVLNSANMFSQCDIDRLSEMKFNPFRLNKFKSESCHYVTEFLEQLFTSKFLPLINKATRITSHTATLIDNIFTNNIEDIENNLNGIIFSDISDHLPIVHYLKQMYLEKGPTLKRPETL